MPEYLPVEPHLLNKHLKKLVKTHIPYMEKPQWDQLTLFPTEEDKDFRPLAYFSDATQPKKPILDLWGYLALSNCVELASAYPAFPKVGKYLKTEPFRAFLYSIPNPWVKYPGWGYGGRLVLSLQLLLQIVPIFLETLLYFVATAISSLYRNFREGMNNTQNLGWRYLFFIGWILFGVLNIAAQALFCAANTLNYARKTVDGLIHLCFNFLNVNPLNALQQIGKNLLRLLPAAIALACYCIPGLQPAGVFLTAIAGKVIGGLGTLFTCMGTTTACAGKAALPAFIMNGLALWQMLRKFGQRLLYKPDPVNDKEEIPSKKPDAFITVQNYIYQQLLRRSRISYYTQQIHSENHIPSPRAPRELFFWRAHRIIRQVDPIWRSSSSDKKEESDSYSSKSASKASFK